MVVSALGLEDKEIPVTTQKVAGAKPSLRGPTWRALTDFKNEGDNEVVGYGDNDDGFNDDDPVDDDMSPEGNEGFGDVEFIDNTVDDDAVDDDAVDADAVWVAIR